MQISIRKKRSVWIISGVIFALAILYTLAYINEVPGGLSDWRMSHALELEETIHIPLGRTPEDAILKFRHTPSIEVIHKESVRGGVLLFYQRIYGKDGEDLQVEYVRKTWFGWKWVWGGGYGIGKSDNSVLNYMSIPRDKSIFTAFPIVFGDVLDSSINNVIVEVKGEGDDTGKYTATLIGMETGHPIWFVVLPSGASAPLDISGLNREGRIIAFKTVTNPRDSGPIHLRN